MKSSGEYTPKFCENVLECWFQSKDVIWENDGFQMEPNFVPYQKLWGYVFAESKPRKEDAKLNSFSASI